jgi:hypothetical protein
MRNPKPKCFKCGRFADYCKHGAVWVCLKCYPWETTKKEK